MQGGIILVFALIRIKPVIKNVSSTLVICFFKININVLCEWIFNHTISQGNVLTYDKRHVLLKLWSVIFLLLSDVLRLYSHNAASTNDTSKKTMMIEIIEITSAELADEALSKKTIRINQYRWYKQSQPPEIVAAIGAPYSCV